MQFSRRRLVILSIIVFLALGYTAAGFWGVPLLARSQLQKFAEMTLHRQLSLGIVQFNPFTFELQVADFALKEKDGTPITGFRHLYVNAEPASSLWEQSINLRELRLDAPDLIVAIDEAGRLNLAHLLPASDGANTDKSQALPKVHIGVVSATQGHIAFSDLSKGSAYHSDLQAISISVKDFRTETDYKNVVSIAALSKLEEKFELSADLKVQPLSASGHFAIRQLQMPPLADYLAATLPFRIADGKLSVEARYNFAAFAQASRPSEWELSLDKITASNFVVAETGAAASSAAIVIPAIEVTSALVSSVGHKVTVKALDAMSPLIDIRRDSDGVLNLSRYLAHNDAQVPVSTPQPAAEASTAASSKSTTTPQDQPWQFKIEDTRIETGTVNITDATVTPAASFVLKPVTLHIANLGTAGDNMHLTSDVVIDSDSSLKLDGDLALAPLQAGVNIDLERFALPALQPYLAQQSQLSLASGIFSMHGRIDYLQQQADLKFGGEITIDNVHANDKANDPFVDWKQLTVKGIKAVINPDSGALTSLDVDSIVADQPYANVQIRKDQTTNVSHLLAPPLAQSAGTKPVVASNAGKADTGPSLKTRIQIASIKFIDGSADFSDLSIEPNFSTGIVQLNGAVSGLSSQPDSRATVTLQGNVDKFSPVNIAGEINPLAANKFSDVTLKFSNIELTTFNPYSGKYAGYNISKGKLSADMHYRILDRKLEAEHHVIFDNLEFGSKTDSKDAAPIPLKLAVALLKDSNGLIIADLPVSGTLDDPQFRLAPLIWRACLGLLGDVAKAPFAALARLFGSSDELAFVEFQPGIAELSPAETGKLTTLAKALVARPTLKLNIPLNTIAATDSDALAQQSLQALATATTDVAVRATQLAALELEYKNRSGKDMVYPASAPDAAATTADAVIDTKIQTVEQALLPLLKPNADDLADLARRRAEAVEALILGNTAVLPERIFLVNEESKPAKGKVAAAVKMEMHLE